LKVKVKRAVIYARVSTDIQRENYSVPTQIEECVKFAELRGYAIVGEQHVDPDTGLDQITEKGGTLAYVDDISHSELNRPSLDAALNYLERVGFDILVVHALDRMARDPYIRQTLEREFSARNAMVEYVLGNYDDTPEGEIRKDLDATFAKWENAKRVERCMRGRRKKARSGLWAGGKVLYGYEQNESALGGLASVEEQARVIRRIFELYAIHGESIRGIAQTLTDEGAATWSGNSHWGKSSVARILKNPAYIGRAHYDGIEIEITPIVEEWIFEEAQRRLEQNKKLMRRRPKRPYLLTGMIFCEECKGPYFAQTKKPNAANRQIHTRIAYRHRMTEGHCINREISARKIEPAVWEEIREMLMDPERLLRGYEASLERQKATHERQRQHLISLGSRIQKFKQQRQNLNMAYTDPDIPMSKAEYIQQKTVIDREIGELGQEIETLEVQLAKIPTPAELKTLEEFSARVREKLLHGKPTKEDKRRILEMLHVKTWIYLDGRIRIDGWFGDSLLSQVSVRYARLRLLPLRPVLHAPGL
jgi:site-specific DNA recombinase